MAGKITVITTTTQNQRSRKVESEGHDIVAFNAISDDTSISVTLRADGTLTATALRMVNGQWSPTGSISLDAPSRPSRRPHSIADTYLGS